MTPITACNLGCGELGGLGMMQLQRDTGRWAEQTFGRCELGDVRRTRRLVRLAGQCAGHAGFAPARACRGDAAANEGAYRLLRNDAVAPEAIAEGGFAASAEAARGCAELLAVEDTTTLSYRHGVAPELGDLGGHAGSTKRGFWVHSVLLLDAASERTVGLIEQRRWCRASAARGQRRRRRERAYENKESIKWQRASEAMARRLGETLARVISVCDREADVYEYLHYKHAQGQRFIVRAAWPRCVQDEGVPVLDVLAQAPVLGEHTVALAQRGGAHARRARPVRLEVRAARVRLRPPHRAPGLGALEVNAIWAYEPEPPQAQEPLQWLLFTGEPIDTLAAAVRVLGYYALRWRIEDFHKAWKSGAKVEQRRMQSAANLERMAVVLAFVAVRLLQLREGLEGPQPVSDKEKAPGKRAPRISCAGVLDETEWQVLWLTDTTKPLPEEAPSLRWAYEAVAKLGGWLDTKGTGRAGWEAMWHGWFRLQERVDGYLMAQGRSPAK